GSPPTRGARPRPRPATGAFRMPLRIAPPPTSKVRIGETLTEARVATRSRMPRMSSVDEPAALLDRMLGGDRRALARLLSLAESEPERFDAVADRVAAAPQARAGRTLRVGLTGPGGAGKSSLIDALVRVLRARGETVAILATDPSSERTGGALLGDRVRLAQEAPDEGVFFRSVATRGAAGGLAHT